MELHFEKIVFKVGFNVPSVCPLKNIALIPVHIFRDNNVIQAGAVRGGFRNRKHQRRCLSFVLRLWFGLVFLDTLQGCTTIGTSEPLIWNSCLALPSITFYVGAATTLAAVAINSPMTGIRVMLEPG